MNGTTNRADAVRINASNPSSFICEHEVKRGFGCLLCAEKHRGKIKRENEERSLKDALALKEHAIQVAIKNAGMEGLGLSRTFENYTIYDERQTKVFEACKKYAYNFKYAIKAGSCMVFLGDRGTGKNHLAYAIANHVINDGYRALFRSSIDIFMELHDTRIKGYVGPGQKEIIDKLKSPDLLIIDEIGIQSKTEFEERIIFKIIDDRKKLWKPVILLSNCTSKTIIEYIGLRTMDRLREGRKGGDCVLYFEWLSYRSRVATDPLLPSGSG